MNTAVNTMNTAVRNYCEKTDGCYYIDATKGFIEGGVLAPLKTADGLHINILYMKDYIKNIQNAVSNISSGSTDTDKSGYPSLIKKLLPNSLAEKSYKTTGFSPQFIIIHNMGRFTNQGAYDL